MDDPLLDAAVRHRDTLLLQAWVRCRDWSLAEDAVQEAFAVALRRRADFDARRPMLPWLAGIVANCVRGELRRRGRGDDALLDRLAAATAEIDAAEADQDHARLAALTDCVDALPPASRHLVRAYFVDGAAVKTLAAATGRSVNAIDLALSRLRRALHDCAQRRLAQEDGR